MTLIDCFLWMLAVVCAAICWEWALHLLALFRAGGLNAIVDQLKKLEQRNV